MAGARQDLQTPRSQNLCGPGSERICVRPRPGGRCLPVPRSVSVPQSSSTKPQRGRLLARSPGSPHPRLSVPAHADAAQALRRPPSTWRERTGTLEPPEGWWGSESATWEAGRAGKQETKAADSSGQSPRWPLRVPCATGPGQPELPGSSQTQARAAAAHEGPLGLGATAPAETARPARRGPGQVRLGTRLRGARRSRGGHEEERLPPPAPPAHQAPATLAASLLQKVPDARRQQEERKECGTTRLGVLGVWPLAAGRRRPGSSHGRGRALRGQLHVKREGLELPSR